MLLMLQEIYELLADNKENIEKMWHRIDNEVELINSDNYEKEIKRIRQEKEEILKQELGMIYQKIEWLGIKKILDISKLFTKAWEGTIKHYQEKGISEIQLLEDKLNHHLHG